MESIEIIFFNNIYFLVRGLVAHHLFHSMLTFLIYLILYIYIYIF